MTPKDALYRATQDLAADITAYSIKVDLAARTVTWGGKSTKVPPFTRRVDCLAIIRRHVRRAQQAPRTDQIALL